MKLISIPSVKGLMLITAFIIETCISGVCQNLVVHPTYIITSTAHDISPPLADMHIMQSDSGKSREEKEVPNHNLSIFYNELNELVASDEGRDPVLQSSAGVLWPNTTIVNMDGINNVSNFIPPDPVGDIGANHYIQAVNTSFAIYSKTGDLIFGPASMATIWTGFPGPHTSDGDPIVLYDHLADRWLITQFSLPNYPNGLFMSLLPCRKPRIR